MPEEQAQNDSQDSGLLEFTEEYIEYQNNIDQSEGQIVERDPETEPQDQGQLQDQREGEEIQDQEYEYAMGAEDNIENDIDDMIADLLEVIYNEEVDYPEKIKVIKIFLHHTYDLIQAQKMGIIQNNYNENPEEQMLKEQALRYGYEGEYGLEGEEEDECELEGIREDEREDLPSMEFRSGQRRTPYTSEGKGKNSEREVGWRVVREEEEPEENKEDKEDSSGQYEAEGVGEEQRYQSKEHHHLNDNQLDPQASQQNVQSSSHEGHPELAIQEADPRYYQQRRNSTSRDKEQEEYNTNSNTRNVNSRETPLVQSEEGNGRFEEEIIELQRSKQEFAQKNIILNDEVDLLRQRNLLLQEKISDLKKNLQKAERDRREAVKRGESKSSKLKQSRAKVEKLDEEIKRLNDECMTLQQAAEERAEEWQIMEDRLETLKEINQQLASQNELRSHDYRNSSSFTGLTPRKSESSNQITNYNTPNK